MFIMVVKSIGVAGEVCPKMANTAGLVLKSLIGGLGTVLWGEEYSQE